MLDFLDKLDRLERQIDRALPQETSSQSSGLEQFEPWRDDFPGFAQLLDIVDKDGHRGRLRLNCIQSAFEVSRTGRDIVLKPRQIGFTTSELARDIWYFLTKPGSRVVVVLQSQSDHGALNETSEKIRIMFDGLVEQGFVLDFRTQSTSTWALGDSTLRIVEAGASEKAAGKKGRSGTIHRLHISEAAFFEYAEKTLNALLECVPHFSKGTEIVIESTANGPAGAYYERYMRAKLAGDEYVAHFFAWITHAEYATPLEAGETITPQTDRERELVEKHGGTPEQLKWYRAKVKDKKQALADQEYPLDEETCWLTPGRTFFDRDSVVAMRSSAPIREELHGQGITVIDSERERATAALRIWKDPVLPDPAKGVAGRRYVVIADPSEGTGGDPGAATVHDRETGEHVATLHGQFPPGRFAELLHNVGHRYNRALIVVERNNHGHAVIQALVAPPKVDPPHVQRVPYPNVYKGPDEKHGWVSTEVTRTSALDALEDAQRKGEFTTPDPRVRGEMLVFIVNKHGKAEAASGAHDDLVICSAIGWNVMRVSRPKPPPNRGVSDSPLLPFG
jgi:hypothetical protein